MQMHDEESRILPTTSVMALMEARDRLHTIMNHDMAEAIEQIGQTLEACQTKKVRLLSRLDEVLRAVETVREECSCIDTTIASKVLHLNKLATQIVQQMACVRIPDQPPPPPEPLPPPIIEIDLTAVHERLSGLDHMVHDLTKLIMEKEDTVLYVIQKRPGHGEIASSAHPPIRIGDITQDRQEHMHSKMAKLESLVQSIESEYRIHPQESHSQKRHLHPRRPTALASALSSFNVETSFTNGQHHGAHSIDDDEDETSRESDQTTVGPCTLCIQERTEEVTTAKQSEGRQSVASGSYTEQSHSDVTTSAHGTASEVRRLGEALASNGTDIAYYDYEQKMIRVAGVEEHAVQFEHGIVVDLYWWSLNREWLILSEQGLYRWKASDAEYHDAYEFSNGEIGFRRIAVTSTGIFGLFRYSLMLLELSNGMQMKRLHALAPPETTYRKLADISVRKLVQEDGREDDILGLIWFGSGPGILLEERYVTPHANNTHERLFRHVDVRKGRYARLAPYDGGRAWLISNTGASTFWIVDNSNVVADRGEATATWVEVSSGVPINAVGTAESTVCIRLQNGKLEYLASAN